MNRAVILGGYGAVGREVVAGPDFLPELAARGFALAEYDAP
jgi:hypothetical protein